VKGLLPDLPAGAPPDGSPVTGSVIVGSGQIQSADGSTLPNLSGSAQLPAGVPEIAVAGGGELPAGILADVTAQVFNADHAREGTAEECAALHDQAVDMASQVAASRGQQVTTSGTVTGSASVATQP
jgi:hypothetical protein